MQNGRNEAADLEKKIMTLEISKRKLMGEGLDSCSLDELQQLEHQLEKALANVKARKVAFMKNKALTYLEKNKPLNTVYLPQELWPGILCCLPVKSLLRFRCVSKSWLSLIDDAGFARLHLKKFKNNCDQTHLLVVQGTDRNCVVKHSDTFETNSEILLTLGYMYSRGRWDFVCSVDGLVLLKRTRSGLSSSSDLKVWNPSIRKFHDFPSLPEIISTNRYFWDAEIGLGYDPLANDYKHVKLVRVDPNTYLVAVYSLGTGSWKMIPFQGKGCSWHWDMCFLRCEWNKKFYLRGSLYFIARVAYDYNFAALVSFDLSSEVFSYINMPELPNVSWSMLALIDGGCSVAAFDDSSLGTSMWVLESESMCWSKRYSFCSNLCQFWYFKKNGDVLTQKAHPETFTEEAWDEVVLYNPETKEHKILQGREYDPTKKHKIVQLRGGSSLYPIIQASAYVESLILLK